MHKKYLIIAVLLLMLAPMIHAQESLTIPVACGDIVEGEFTLDEQPQLYAIELSSGDGVDISAIALDSSTLSMTMALYAPNDVVLWTVGERNGGIRAPMTNPRLITDNTTSAGTHTIVVYNSGLLPTGSLGSSYSFNDAWQGGIGAYTLEISCVLRDGTVIEPSEILESVASDETTTDTSADVASSSDTGQATYRFSGLAPIDLIAEPEDTLTLGAEQNISLGDATRLFIYDASADETRTFTMSRIAGDISMGLVVTNADTDEMIFLGGMPSSDNLSVEITFLSNGIYRFGVFRLDTTEKQNTSGLVQLILE